MKSATRIFQVRLIVAIQSGVEYDNSSHPYSMFKILTDHPMVSLLGVKESTGNMNSAQTCLEDSSFSFLFHLDT